MGGKGKLGEETRTSPLGGGDKESQGDPKVKSTTYPTIPLPTHFPQRPHNQQGQPNQIADDTPTKQGNRHIQHPLAPPPRLLLLPVLQHIEDPLGPIRPNIVRVEQDAQMEGDDHAIETHDQRTVPQHQHQPVGIIGGGPSDGGADDAGDEGGGEGDELELAFGVFLPEEDFGFFGGGGAHGD